MIETLKAVVSKAWRGIVPDGFSRWARKTWDQIVGPKKPR